MRRGFAALAHYIDDKIGALLGLLDETGQRDNTIVIVTSDHGEMLGVKGMIQKRSLYEWSARIPLFIDIPGTAPCTVDTPVSLLDVPATLVDMAGAQLAAPMQGRSLLAAAQGADLPQVPIISEYHGEGIMRPSFMVRLGDWKYHYCHGSAPQLFNLAEDPGEWVNRAGDPAVAQIEGELHQIIISGFDLEKIKSEVWDRLALKKVVNDAMAQNGTAWDYKPDADANALFVRS